MYFRVTPPEFAIIHTEDTTRRLLDVEGLDTGQQSDKGYLSHLDKRMMALVIMNRASIMTPVETGTLKKSIYMKAHADCFEVGYTADYAVYVHEVGSNKHKPPTQYKFLEDAAFETVNEFYESTGIDVNVTIEYSPQLRVFVGGYKTPGARLTSMKAFNDNADKTIYFNDIMSKLNNLEYENIVDPVYQEYMRAHSFLGRYLSKNM